MAKNPECFPKAAGADSKLMQTFCVAMWARTHDGGYELINAGTQDRCKTGTYLIMPVCNHGCLLRPRHGTSGEQLC